MKRCPQCEFLFPDTDKLCDFDKTPLVTVADAEIDRVTNPLATPTSVSTPAAARRQRRKALLIATVAGVALGIILLVVYHRINRTAGNQQSTQPNSPVVSEPLVTTYPPAQPSPSSDASPLSVQVAPVDSKMTAAPSRTAHANVSTGPVSTSSQTKNAATGKPVIIHLSSGGKVEADEVWRTKEGVWYRRDGVVTLLKSNRVKAIVSP